jgi:hypothetical protein
MNQDGLVFQVGVTMLSNGVSGRGFSAAASIRENSSVQGRAVTPD